MSRRLLHTTPALLAACVLLAGCGGADDPARRAAAADGGTAEELPAPERTSGAVTGMPDPGQPGDGGIELGRAPGQPDARDDAEATALDEADAGDIGEGDDSTLPQPADANALDGRSAAALLRRYYALLNARDVEAARQLWHGQDSPLQLLPPDVISVVPSIGTPSRIDAGAGQRHVELPVTLEQTLTDGSTRSASGVAVLQGSMVEGAAPGWRISAIRMR